MYGRSRMDLCPEPEPKPEAPRRATGEHPVTVGELKRTLSWHDLRIAAAAVASVVGGTILAWQFLQAEARAQSHVVTQEVVRRLETAEQAQKEHAASSAAIHQMTRAEIGEVQRDIRELYRTVTTGKPSPRLAQPVPDVP